MVKNSGWYLRSQVTNEVRRPRGSRQITKKTYVNNKNTDVITVYTAPRRPKYTPYGKVVKWSGKTFEDRELYVGSKNGAEEYVEKYFKK